MSNINVNILNFGELKLKKETKLLDIANKYQEEFKYPIVLANINNELFDLNKRLFYDSNIEFLDIKSKYGYRTYQNSIVFLLVYVVKQILGKDARVVIKNSINKNYYCEIIDKNLKLSKELLDEISLEMHRLVDQDLKIEKVTLELEEAIEYLKEFQLYDKIKLLNYSCLDSIDLYKINNFYNYFIDYIVPSTGYLKIFDLVKVSEGFLLIMPDPYNPNILNEIKPLKKLGKVFKESYNWTKILKIETAGDLNNQISSGYSKDIIRVSEALQEKKIANIADSIHNHNKKIILIAGPSSSGKTTFAKRLEVQLRVNGLLAHIISLDDYYLDREHIPKDKFGELDFECLEAIDVKKVNEDLEMLLKGKEIDLPKFNFKLGKKEYKGNYLKMGKDDVLIIEGIHGLNYQIASNISNSKKFKIFISALTQINLDDHNKISTTDARLIRRIVRDNKFRQTDAATNISMWNSVIRGEITNIFPYQEDADVIFNSSLIYEISVLKQYAEPLLFCIDRDMSQYNDAKRLIKLLDKFLSIECSKVPDNSILREFIG